MNTDHPILGISLMLGFCIVAPIGDAVAKVLGASVPLGEVVLVRFAVQAIVLIPLIWVTGRMWRMTRSIFALTFFRTVLHILGIAAMFTALKYLPLADAVATVFVMPFFLLILGKYVLHEEVGMRRITACIIGFIGTLMVVQPSFAQVGWPALLPVFVAANFSVFMLVTRKIAKHTDPIGLQAVSGVLAIALILPFLWLGQHMGAGLSRWVNPTQHEWSLMLTIGFIGTVAHLLMTWSLRYAPSTTLAPMQYLEIPFATLIGFVVFHDLPNPLASLGILIISGAGIYCLIRERAIARRQAQLAATQPTPIGVVPPSSA